jgi:hypothetical protein
MQGEGDNPGIFCPPSHTHTVLEKIKVWERRKGTKYCHAITDGFWIDNRIY